MLNPTLAAVNPSLLKAIIAFWILLTSSCGTDVRAQAQVHPHPLTALTHQTGWVLLGYIDLRTNTWSTAIKYRPASSTYTEPLVPGVGETIVITMPQDVFIVGFKTSGELEHLASPADIPTSRDYLTGVTLAPGTTVKVKDIKRSQPYGSLQSVWARVGVPN